MIVTFNVSVNMAQDISKVGVVNISSQHCSNLSVTGVANLEEMTVDKTLSVTGPVNAQKCQFGNASIIGAVNFKDVMIHQKLDVTGAFNADDCKLQTINITGEIALSRCDIEQEAKLCGGVAAQDSKFHADILLDGNKFAFQNCNVVKSIMVKKESWFNWWFKTQTILLKNTVVHGDIIFETEGGIVELHKSAKVHGKIIGAKIVQK